MPAWWMAASFCCCCISWVMSRSVTIRCFGRPLEFPHRGRVHLEETAVLAAERGTGALAGGQGGVEGTEVGAQDLGAVQGRVELHAHHRVAPTPLVDPLVGPEDSIIGLQESYPVGYALEDLFVLQERAGLEGVAEGGGDDEHPVEVLASQQFQDLP